MSYGIESQALSDIQMKWEVNFLTGKHEQRTKKGKEKIKREGNIKGG